MCWIFHLKLFLQLLNDILSRSPKICYLNHMQWQEISQIQSIISYLISRQLLGHKIISPIPWNYQDMTYHFYIHISLGGSIYKISYQSCKWHNKCLCSWLCDYTWVHSCFRLILSPTTVSVGDDTVCRWQQSQKTKFVVDDKSCLFILWQTLSSATTLVFWDCRRRQSLSRPTKSVADDSLCRWWQC